MSDLFSRMEPGQLIGLVAVAGGMLCGIFGILSHCCLEMRKVSAATELKQSLVERGMSAEEIQTVLEAGADSAGKSRCGKRSCRV